MRILAWLIVFSPSLALACGGVFCSGGPQQAPVDQAAETILFDVNGGTICAHVTIDYTGDANEFAWLVPVPDTPEIGETDPAVFAQLTAATNLNLIPPEPNFDGCNDSFDDDGGGCGCSGDNSLASPSPVDDGPFPEDPVQVLSRTQTENYDIAVVLADDTDALVEWLDTNNYNVSDNMRPAMAVYIEEEMKFVAVRLRDGRDASRIRPIRMCYRAFAPAIPLRLTAVAAQPLMGIRVFIIADEYYVPHEHLAPTPDGSSIGLDATGRTGYAAWTARKVDEARGRLFITEFRGDNPGGDVGFSNPELGRCFEENDCDDGETCVVENGDVRGLCDGKQPYAVRQDGRLSRYYTRLSPKQMVIDPIFIPAPDAEPVQATLDFSNQRSPQSCDGIDPELLPSPCAFNYCGNRATCRVDLETLGCECSIGTVAQQITSPTGQPEVTCVPRASPFAVQDDAMDVNPCDALPCGPGECVLRGGFRACACEPGTMAVTTERGVMCQVFVEDAAAFGPGAGPESLPAFEPGVTRELKRSGPWMGLLLVLVVVVTRRRRG